MIDLNTEKPYKLVAFKGKLCFVLLMFSALSLFVGYMAGGFGKVDEVKFLVLVVLVIAGVWYRFCSIGLVVSCPIQSNYNMLDPDKESKESEVDLYKRLLKERFDDVVDEEELFSFKSFFDVNGMIFNWKRNRAASQILAALFMNDSDSKVSKGSDRAVFRGVDAWNAAGWLLKMSSDTLVVVEMERIRESLGNVKSGKDASGKVVD